MENFKKKFKLTEDFTNVVVLNSMNDLKKYEERLENKYTWKGDADEWDNYVVATKNLNSNIKQLLGANWQKTTDYINSKAVYDFETEVNNIALGKYDAIKFREALNEIVKFKNIEQTKIDDFYEEIIISADYKATANKYQFEGVAHYSNFFKEREKEIKHPNSLGLSADASKLKFSYDNPDKNLLIINFDLNLPNESVLDVYGNVMANNINAGLIGCRSLKAKDIRAMKLVASNVEANNLIVNMQGNKVGFNSMFYDLTYKEEISEEVFGLLEKEAYDEFDILVGDIEMIEPSLLDSYEIGLKDKTDVKPETIVNVEFSKSSNFKGGLLDVKNDVIGQKIWANTIYANRVVCSNVISGSEKNDYKVNVDTLRNLYESQKGYKFKDLLVQPNKIIYGSLINANALLSETVKAKYIKAVDIDSPKKITADFIDANYINSETIEADSINCNVVKADSLKVNVIDKYEADVKTIEAKKMVSKEKPDEALKGLRKGVVKKTGFEW